MHPIDPITGRHYKDDPSRYIANTIGVRHEAPGALVITDSSLNGVDLKRDCTREEYLRVRLAGLDNPAKADMTTIIATNEALLVNTTPGGFPKPYVEEFIRRAGRILQKNNMLALTEVTQEPFGMSAVHRALEILKEDGTKLPGLGFAFLVNGTPSFPAYDDKRALTHTDVNGFTVQETPKERFMRLIGEAIKIKDDNNLPGPFTFGTILRDSDDSSRTGHVLQHDVWDWVAEAAVKYEKGLRKYGIILKGGLEEWASFQGRQITNSESIAVMRFYMGEKRYNNAPLFNIVTDPKVVRGWLEPRPPEPAILPIVAPSRDLSGNFRRAGRLALRPEALINIIGESSALFRPIADAGTYKELLPKLNIFDKN